jgi:hypothetical protein
MTTTAIHGISRMVDPHALPATEMWFIVGSRTKVHWYVCSNGTEVRDEHMVLCVCDRKEDANWLKNLLNFQALHGPLVGPSDNS